MNKSFLTIAIILFPLQTLSLFIMGSRYDLSAFVLLLLAMITIIRFGISGRSAFILACFVLLHLVLFLWFDIAPFYRVFSAYVWLGGLIYFFLEGRKIKYDQKMVFKLITLVLSISALYIFLQFFAFGQDRPSAWFYEPSFAGLCLYGAAAGLLMSLILVRHAPAQKLMITLFFIFFAAALMTYSMHIVTFFVILSIIGISIVTFHRVSFRLRTLVPIGVFGIFLAYALSEFMQMDHFTSRTDYVNPTNFSLLSWLRGFDQMLAAMKNSFFFGMGLGSVGFFEFQSEYSDILESLGKPELNLTDAFSLAFRLVIELGFPVLLILILYLLRKMRAFKRYVYSSTQTNAAIRFSVIFNFVFALTVIGGCLLKEPLYPQSFLYLAVLLVTSGPLGISQRSGSLSHG